MSAFTITRNPHAKSAAERAAIMEDPGFGQSFSDHMVLVDWEQERGWHDARVVPYGPLTLDPSATVFHYGQEIFEGLKAYRHEDGSVWTFRAEQNARRFNNSARRMALPEIPEELFLEAIAELVRIDADWVPAFDGTESSMYVRPFMFGRSERLGVSPADKVTFSVIAGPASAYFASGVKPVSLLLSKHYSRAGAGGTGAAKCGGNYAASLAAQLEAKDYDCDQVVFLDANEQRYVEELGGMNLFFVYADGRLVTPALTGTILPGVTRSSVLTMAQDQGLQVSEERVTIKQWQEGVASGEISEVFACGTAAVITPVGRLVWEDGQVDSAPAGVGGPVSLRIRENLLGIQQGRDADPHGWMHQIVPSA